jgi:hypothetical protein
VQRTGKTAVAVWVAFVAVAIELGTTVGTQMLSAAEHNATGETARAEQHGWRHRSADARAGDGMTVALSTDQVAPSAASQTRGGS